jgi:hypothetical protein
MLLTADRAAAEADGQALLRYASDQGTDQTSDRYLQIIKAEGELFSGNSAGAITAARAALASFPPRGTSRRFAASQLAKVLAWAGAQEEAVELLEEIATEFPALGPAEVTRDPLYALPLAANAHYRALERKLETEIAANQTLIESALAYASR